MKNFIEVNGSNHLNVMFNESVENVEQMKLKNKKQSDVRSFFRSEKIFCLHYLLVSYEKKSSSLIYVVFFAQKVKASI